MCIWQGVCFMRDSVRVGETLCVCEVLLEPHMCERHHMYVWETLCVCVCSLWSRASWAVWQQQWQSA